MNSASSTSTYTLAAFDFDGTITRGDSLQVFLRYFRGWHGFLGAVILSSPWLVLMVLRVISRHQAKERVLRFILAGCTSAELEQAAKAFAEGPLNHLIRPEMLARIDWHRQQGHRLVLVSASPSVYLRYWAAQYGFETVLSTELEQQDGRFTGRLASRNCWGPEKVQRLQAWWGDAAPALMHAYGDTRGDREMLARADHAWFRGQPIK